MQRNRSVGIRFGTAVQVEFPGTGICVAVQPVMLGIASGGRGGQAVQLSRLGVRICAEYAGVTVVCGITALLQKSGMPDFPPTVVATNPFGHINIEET